MKLQIRRLYKQGYLELSLRGREGKSGSSICQATPTGVDEGFDMTCVGGTWASFAEGGDTPGLGGVWWGK